MFGEIALALWSAAGLAWWLIAWRLVRSETETKSVRVSPASPRTLSIFKPLPPLGADGLEEIAEGLESFVAQLDPESELLLGAHKADEASVAPFVEAMREKYAKVQVRLILRSEADEVMNPKIAWQMVLAKHATGELWFWSDADIVAPPGFLHLAQQEFAICGKTMLTFPYVVRRCAGRSALLEALFVNLEFFPGVLLLRGLGPVDFGLGAGMLFERKEFLKRVDWRELGAFLADDFQLGQRLRPVQIGMTTLEAMAPKRKWFDALQHDLRWGKTIRWNCTGGFFARLLILPVTGWLIAAAAHPQSLWPWAGLLGMIQADVLFAIMLCGKIGCRVRWKDGCLLEAWSLWRVALWIASWMPGPVVWSGRHWHGPKGEMPKSG